MSENTIVKSPQNIAKELYKKNLELLKQGRRIEQLLYSVSEAILAINKDNKITISNRALETMLGLDEAQVLGKDADKLLTLTTENNKPIKLSKLCFVPAKPNQAIQGVILRGKRNYYVNIKTAVLESEDVDTPECLITITDITSEKMLDDLKDDFLSVAAHELRTPMTIIKSYIWMLMSNKAGELSDKQRDYLEKAEGGTERLIALVNDMLNISKIEQGRLEYNLEKVNLTEILTELGTEFKLKTDEKNLYLHLEIDKNIQVFTDKNKLTEIITNLVGNAIKFTDTGGITIRAQKLKDRYVKVSIIDTGKGIKKQDLSRLFRKFGRLDNSYRTVAEAGGTGLGLYITKNLIEKMGGSIGVISEGIGKGSTFWITIPVKEPLITHNKENGETKSEAINSLVPSATQTAETPVTSVAPTFPN